MSSSANIVHEADAQRHHVRVKLPAQIEIGGALYETRDWSTAGASVLIPDQASSAVFADGKVHRARMIFSFAGFTLSVPMMIEVRHSKEDADTKAVGVRYIDMTQEQVVIMQQMVSSYVTGELSSVGEILHVVSRNNFTKPRQVPKKEEMTAGERIGAMLKAAAVPVLSLALLAYVALAVFEQAFVVSSQKAFLDGEGTFVAAASGGMVSFKDVHPGMRVRQGEALMTIVSDTGTIAGVDSPCDCIVAERFVEQGAPVSKGQTIYKLISVDAPLWVESMFSHEDALRMERGQTAMLQIPGANSTISGRIDSIGATRGSGDAVKVVVSPIEKLPVELLGSPVGVKINTLAGGE